MTPAQWAQRLGVPVRELSPGEEASIVALPRAQRRTASFKKAVFVGEETVYKGPYDAGDDRLRANLVNTALAAELARWLGVEPTVAPWGGLLRDGAGRYYLAAASVGDARGAVWSVVSTRVESEVKVIERGSFVRRVSELEKTPLLAPPGLWAATLQHLYVIYLLGIGDHGSHNVLCGADGRATGIDLEESRSNHAPASRIDALFKRPSAAQRALYAPLLGRVRRLDRPPSAEQRERALALGATGATLQGVWRSSQAFEALPP